MTGERRGAQLIRTLHLIRCLDVTWYELGQLAELFHVTRRTIRRDIAFLREHGFVIDTRDATVSDRADVEWRIRVWPERYDLTQARRIQPTATERAS